MKRPGATRFDVRRHAPVLAKLHPHMMGREFEQQTQAIAEDILKTGENFELVQVGPNFPGTPFDFFGLKNGKPFLIEYKGSLRSFRLPGKIQRRRLRQVAAALDDIGIALLQVRLPVEGASRSCEYRMLYDDELRALFKERKAPIKPIVGWVRERLPGC